MPIAARRDNLLPRQVERLADRIEQSLPRRSCARAAEHSIARIDELVAAEPRNGVARAQRRLQPSRHRDEQIVADGVAETVVHQLEPVEVEQQPTGPSRTVKRRNACSTRSANSARFDSPVRLSWKA